MPDNTGLKRIVVFVKNSYKFTKRRLRRNEKWIVVYLIDFETNINKYLYEKKKVSVKLRNSDIPECSIYNNLFFFSRALHVIIQHNIITNETIIVSCFFFRFSVRRIELY